MLPGRTVPVTPKFLEKKADPVLDPRRRVLVKATRKRCRGVAGSCFTAPGQQGSCRSEVEVVGRHLFPSHLTATSTMGGGGQIRLEDTVFPRFCQPCSTSRSCFTSSSFNALIMLSIAPSIISGMSWKFVFILWSVTRSCEKLYVRIFSERSPVPI